MPSTEDFWKGITIHTPRDANTPCNYLMVVEVKSVKYALQRRRQAQISKKRESKAQTTTPTLRDDSHYNCWSTSVSFRDPRRHTRWRCPVSLYIRTKLIIQPLRGGFPSGSTSSFRFMSGFSKLCNWASIISVADLGKTHLPRSTSPYHSMLELEIYLRIYRSVGITQLR